MATAKARIGLKKVEIGDVAGDGGMGTALTEVGATVSDTCLFSTGDPNETDFSIEESTIPFHTETTPGKIVLTWSSYNVEPASLVPVMGGSVTTDASGNSVYSAPNEQTSVEKSVKCTMKDNTVLAVPRGKLFAKLQYNFQRTKLAQVDFTYTVLIPTKANTAPYTITTPAS
jgi:hypothetical protein